VDHWMFGAGYGSFWGIGPDGPVYDYAKGWLWELHEGHNGYLDLLATIGVPGLALVIIGTTIVPLGSLLLSQTANGARGALLVGLIFFAAVHNIGESTLFDRDSISWTFMLFAIALTSTITPDLTIRFFRRRPDSRLWRVDDAEGRDGSAEGIDAMAAPRRLDTGR